MIDLFPPVTSSRLFKLLLTFVLSLHLSWAQAETQTFTTLTPNWNLLTFQVIPTNASPAAVFGSLPGFQAAWTYEASTGNWLRYVKSADPVKDAQENSFPTFTFSKVEPGRAYWVYLTSAPGPWQVVGALPSGVTFPTLSLQNESWNLIGIPTGSTDLLADGYLKPGESINLLSVLTRAGFNYSHILRWEQNSQGLQKATPQNTDVDDFSAFDAWRGYFLYVTGADNPSLKPSVLTGVRGDIDVAPSGNYPSHEDLRISGSPTPLDGATQNTIRFFPQEDVQTLGISNTGGGIMIWEAIWTPTVNAGAEPWLTLASSPEERTDFVNGVSQSGRDWKRMKGVTTLENDVLYLRLNRINLTAGTYTGSLKLRTSIGEKTWSVTVEIGSALVGEWRGSARIDTVEGKNNRPPDVDLHLSIFDDPTIPGMVRAMIDSKQSLLWPVDVPLIGYITSAAGNGFSIGGAYVLPPGDQNIPPYDSTTAALTSEDVDWNNDGKLDNINPFPFPIHREVQLRGQVISGSPYEGYKITGSYLEIVSGLMRKSIRVVGTFEIVRESLHPFQNRKPLQILNGQFTEPGTDPFVSYINRPVSAISLPTSRTIAVNTDLALSELSVSVKLDTAGLNPAALQLKLVSPGGLELLLHDNQLAPVEVLANVTFPTTRPSKGDLAAFIRNVGITKGNWTLIASGGSGGKLVEFGLTLTGQPLFDVKGRMVDSANPGTGLVGVQVGLVGAPFNATALTDGAGNFTFLRLPGLPYNFSASLPGWNWTNPASPGLSSATRAPLVTPTSGNAEEIRLASKFHSMPGAPVAGLNVAGYTGGTVGNPFVMQLASLPGPPRISPAPFISGYAPLTIDFAALGTVSGTPAWSFGDSTNGSGKNVTKTYTNSGNFTVTFTHGGAAPQTVQVLVMPSPNRSSYSINCFQVAVTGGGAHPAVVPTILGAVAKSDLVTAQHSYSATADIDLAPFTTSGSRGYSTDNFDPGGAGSFTADSRNRSAVGFKDEDHNYNVGDSSAGWPAQLLWYDIVTNTNYAAAAGYAVDEATYHPHPKVANNGGVPTTHFRMLCNVGPTVLPPPPVELSPGQIPVARNQHFQLITGPLATFHTLQP